MNLTTSLTKPAGYIIKVGGIHEVSRMMFVTYTSLLVE